MRFWGRGTPAPGWAYPLVYQHYNLLLLRHGTLGHGHTLGCGHTLEQGDKISFSWTTQRRTSWPPRLVNVGA